MAKTESFGNKHGTSLIKNRESECSIREIGNKVTSYSDVSLYM